MMKSLFTVAALHLGLALAAGCEGAPMEDGRADLAGPDDLALPPDASIIDGGAAFDLEPPGPDLGRPPPQIFSVIGDFGSGDGNELQVSQLVKMWQPDFVLTTGDNNYPSGDPGMMDKNIGQFYSEFIGHYQGRYGPGSPFNRFWPSIGNHEYYSCDCLQPYFDYFPDLPGNKRYYDVAIGRVHLFAVNSGKGEGPGTGEPDGTTANSKQAAWLKAALAASTACYKIVYFHIPPFSSVGQFTDPNMNWPFVEWGADLVLMGHAHVYERMDIDGVPYMINGLGGANHFGFVGPILPNSKVRFSDDFGAIRAEAGDHGMKLEFITIARKLVDTYVVAKECH